MSDADDDVIQRATERVGTVLRGKWRLERLLGVGGMASVYAAVHRNGMRGAVKMLHAELSTHAGARDRFLREGYAANTVEHEGAVTVLDDDAADDGSVFLVMELLDGDSIETLAQRLGGKLALAEVAAIGVQLLDVLAAAHDKGIWHRDLKPENLFVTRQGRVKVLDFGIAKVKQTAASSRATSTGSVMGTPAFMPPEQALGRWSQVDGRTDLFAVGATLLNILTGALLHRGETAAEVLVSAATKPAPPVRTIDPTVPEAVALVLDKALAFKRDERWADARSMRDALHEAAGSGDLSRIVAMIESRPSILSAPVQDTPVPAATLPSEPSQPSFAEEPTAVRKHPPPATPQYAPTSVLPSPGDASGELRPIAQGPPSLDVPTPSPVSMASQHSPRSAAWVAIVLSLITLSSAGAAAWWFGLRTPASATPDSTTPEPEPAATTEVAQPEPDEPVPTPTASESATPSASAPAPSASAKPVVRAQPLTPHPVPQPKSEPSAPATKSSGKVFTNW